MFNGGLHAPCVHAGGMAKNSQTTASWVAELREDSHQHWVTATSAPCTSLYKPIQVDTPLDLPTAEDKFNDSLWWRHEALHRLVTQNSEALLPVYMNERDTVQRKWLKTPPDSAKAFELADELLSQWTTRVKIQPARDIRPSWAKKYWTKRNHRAGLIA